MSITTYNELKTAVASWLHRTDLTSQIPDFIALGEARINRAFSSRFNETDTTLTASVGVRTIALPNDFKRAYGLWMTTYNPRQEIYYRPPTELPVTTSIGTPQYYTIDSSNVAFECPCTLAYTFTLRYKPGFNIASAVNSLLTNHPGVYLFASLCEAAIYLRDDARLAQWEMKYQIEMKEAKDFEAENKSLATLYCESALVGAGSSNIIDGGY